jgi:hypothetical protein
MCDCFGRRLREEAEKRRIKPETPKFEIKSENVAWLSKVREADFDSTKVKTFKQCCPPKLTCNQVAIVLKEFDFARTRLDMLQFAKFRVCDLENYKVISSNQLFSIERSEMDHIMKEEIQRRRYLGIE